MFTATNVVSRTAAKSLLLPIAFLAFLGVNSAAMADGQPVARSKQIVLTDLDLSTQDGRSVALERVHQMARTLCSELADHLDIAHQPHFVACVDRAMTQATGSLQAMANRKNPARFAQAK